MSDHIPFEIQSEIIKKFPIKSLLRFRTVSKQWKSLIDGPKFIKNYHLNNPQHRLLVQYKLGFVRIYTSIIDDNTFPEKKKFPLTAPEPLNLLRHTITLGCVNGLLCFYGFYQDVETKKVIIWNPSVRKYVGIVIPNVLNSKDRCTRIGFGVCPDTSDPKLVKISVDKAKIPNTWMVEVFTLSTRVWKTVYAGTQFKSCDFTPYQVFVDGIIYWHSVGLDEGFRTNYIISFDLKREKFVEVCLTDRLARAHDLVVAKVDESLCLLEYYNEGEISVCGVWTRQDGVNKAFTKIYTVKVEGKSVYYNVLGFRNNGEVLLGMEGDDYKESTIEVYEPPRQDI